MPGGVRARVAVYQQHRRAGAAVPHPEPDLTYVNVIQLKAVEHGYHSGKPPPPHDGGPAT